MSSRNQFMVVGAVLGATLGSLSAWAYIESKATGGLWTTRKDHGREVAVRAGVPEYFRLGLGVFGLVRQVQGMVRVRQA